MCRGQSVPTAASPNGVLAGSAVVVKMVDAVDSTKDEPGKQYKAVAVVASAASGGIDKGAEVTVALVKSGTTWTAQLQSAVVNGQTVPVKSSMGRLVTESGGGAGGVGGGMMGTAGNAVPMVSEYRMLRGYMHARKAMAVAASGEKVNLPEGTQLRFLLGDFGAQGGMPPSAAALAGGAGAGTGEVPFICEGQYSDPKSAARIVYLTDVFYTQAHADAVSKDWTSHLEVTDPVHFGTTQQSAVQFCTPLPQDKANQENVVGMLKRSGEVVQVAWKEPK